MKLRSFAALIAICMSVLCCACGQKEAAKPIVTSSPISVSNEAIEVTVEDMTESEEPLSGGYAADEGGDAQAEKLSDKKEDTEDVSEDGEEAEDDSEEETGEDSEDTGSEDAYSGAAVPGSVENVGLNSGWQYADHSAINSGSAKLYRAAGNRKGVVIAVNAGHGTKGGQSVKTLCHPDGSPKTTGGSTASGSVKAAAVSGGMSFADGASEASVTLREAQILRDILLSRGYDVLMLRDDTDVQLDNVARTVIANNAAACHVSLHWDGDNLSYDKGCFYISTPDAIKGMDPVASHWQQHEALGKALIGGLSANGCKIYKGGSMSIDLTQTSYSTIPSVDIELGNAASAHDDASLTKLAEGLANGISTMF